MSEADILLDGTAFGLLGVMLAFFCYLVYWGIGMWYIHDFLPWLSRNNGGVRT